MWVGAAGSARIRASLEPTSESQSSAFMTFTVMKTLLTRVWLAAISVLLVELC